MGIGGKAQVIARDLIGLAVLCSGVAALVRRICARRGLTILVYHDPDPQTLRRHLRYLAPRYSFITMDQAYQAWRRDQWDALPPYPLVLTMDDGHARNAALEPVLREFGLRPMIYLCSDIVGTERAFWWQTPAARALGLKALKELPDRQMRARLSTAGCDHEQEVIPRQALSWAEVRALGAVADFGGHTRTHPILTRCDDRDGLEEVVGGRRELEERIGQPCPHFAYPNGDCGEREIAWVRQAGYVTARTIESGWNWSDTPLLRLKGFMIPDRASVPWLAAKLSFPPRLLGQMVKAWRETRPGPAGRGGASAASP